MNIKELLEKKKQELNQIEQNKEQVKNAFNQMRDRIEQAQNDFNEYKKMEVAKKGEINVLEYLLEKEDE